MACMHQTSGILQCEAGGARGWMDRPWAPSESGAHSSCDCTSSSE